MTKISWVNQWKSFNLWKFSVNMVVRMHDVILFANFMVYVLGLTDISYPFSHQYHITQQQTHVVDVTTDSMYSTQNYTYYLQEEIRTIMYYNRFISPPM